MSRDRKLRSERVEHAGVRRLRFCHVEYSPGELDGADLADVQPAIYVIFRTREEDPPTLFEAKYAAEISSHLRSQFQDLSGQVDQDEGYLLLTLQESSVLAEQIDLIASIVKGYEHEFSVSTDPQSRRRVEAVVTAFTRLNESEREVLLNEIFTQQVGEGWVKPLSAPDRTDHDGSR